MTASGSNRAAAANVPLVSVVVATFNRADTLGRCLASVEAQTWLDREVLVVDAGSVDGTVDVLRAHERSVAWWTSEPDRGVYDAWNKALPHVRGDWVYFLGADDYLWDAGVLERLAPALARACPPHRVVYGRVHIVKPDGALVETLNEPWGRVRRAFRHKMALCHQGVFHHRSLFEAHGGFDPTFRVLGDYDLLLRELVDHDPLFVPEVVAGMQMGGLSSSFENAVSMVYEANRARRNSNLPGPSLPNAAELALLHVRSWLGRRFGERAANVATDAYRMVRGKPRRWTR